MNKESVSPLGAFNIVLRHLRLFIALPLLTGLLAALLGFLTPPTYEASSTFTVRSEDGPGSGVAAMASQFGLQIGSGGGVGLPFYAEVLRSRELLIRVARQPFEVQIDGDERSGTLMEVLQLEGNGRERLNRALSFLRESLTVTLKRDPGVVELDVETGNPELAEAVNRRLIEVLETFSLERRREQAAAERVFLESRLTEASEDLRNAEQAVTRFLELNREFRDSPELSNQLTQLQRRVDIRQSVYMNLASALDQTKLEEARNLSPITVLDRPEGTAHRSDLPAEVNAALGGVLGLVFAFFVVLLSEYLRTARRDRPDEYAEMQAHLRRFRSGVSRLRS